MNILQQINVPRELQRNHPNVLAHGVEHTGEILLAYLARRIGRNELTAIDVCRAYVEAQLEYATHDRLTTGVLEYAQTINSSPGKKDGLYWEGEPETLVPKAFGDAAAAIG